MISKGRTNVRILDDPRQSVNSCTMPREPRTLLGTWQRLRAWPAGTWLFSKLLGRSVPYSGTIGAHVRDLGRGHARLTLRDRRAVRQHLSSIHAVALVNLGELTSGLALVSALPAGVRAIVLGLSADFYKKARGTVSAETTISPPVVTGPVEMPVTAELRDSTNDLVCRVTVRWRLDQERP